MNNLKSGFNLPFTSTATTTDTTNARSFIISTAAIIIIIIIIIISNDYSVMIEVRQYKLIILFFYS
jgi:hypothetical protein